MQSFTLSIFTENKVGLLHRITTVFTRRHINIESFTTSESEVPGIYRFTIRIQTTEEQVEKLRKQIDKIIGVVKAFILKEEDAVFQEVALYKVKTDRFSNGNFEQIVRDNHARVLAIESDYVMVEKTGHPHETERLLELLEPFGVEGFSRSGLVAISKKPLHLKSYLDNAYLEQVIQ